MDFTVVNFLNTVYTNWKVSLKLPFINIQTSFILYAGYQIGPGQLFNLFHSNDVDVSKKYSVKTFKYIMVFVTFSN